MVQHRMARSNIKKSPLESTSGASGAATGGAYPLILV